MIKKLIPSARITEVADTGSRLQILFGKEIGLAEDKILKPIFADIKTYTDQLLEIIKSDRQLSDLDKADAKRDEIIRNLAKILKGYTAMPMENIKEAGDRLYTIFQKYGLAMIRENYATESAHIESMLGDFSAPNVVQDIAKLAGVSEVIAQLTKAQQDFNALRVAYEKATATAGSQAKSIDVKKQMLQVINTLLVPYLTSMKSLKQTEYVSFADAAAKVIADTNAAISARSKKKTEKSAEVGKLD